VIRPVRRPHYVRSGPQNARQHISFGRGIHSCPVHAGAGRNPRRAQSGYWIDHRHPDQRGHSWPGNDRATNTSDVHSAWLTELHLEFTRYEGLGR